MTAETPARRYVVVRANREGCWEMLGTFEGGNDQAAIRAAVGDEEGTYLAVPERSWRPRILTVTTVKKSAWA